MKKKHPIVYLLEIPVEIMFFAIIAGLGARVDALVFGIGREPAPEGDPFPYFTVIFLSVGVIALVVAVVWSIARFVKETIRLRKKKKAAWMALHGDENQKEA